MRRWSWKHFFSYRILERHRVVSETSLSMFSLECTRSLSLSRERGAPTRARAWAALSWTRSQRVRPRTVGTLFASLSLDFRGAGQARAAAARRGRLATRQSASVSSTTRGILFFVIQGTLGCLRVGVDRVSGALSRGGRWETSSEKPAVDTSPSDVRNVSDTLLETNRSWREGNANRHTLHKDAGECTFRPRISRNSRKAALLTRAGDGRQTAFGFVAAVEPFARF